MNPLRHLRLGIESGFPICCVLRYTVTAATRPTAQQARDFENIHYTADGTPFVGCRIFHRGGDPFGPAVVSTDRPIVGLSILPGWELRIGGPH